MSNAKICDQCDNKILYDNDPSVDFFQITHCKSTYSHPNAADLTEFFDFCSKKCIVKYFTESERVEVSPIQD